MSSGTGIVYIIIVVMLLAISLGFAIPIGICASRRGMNPVGWGVLAFFTWIVGLVLFLLNIQPVMNDMRCPFCGNLIPINHVFCPFCGHRD